MEIRDAKRTSQPEQVRSFIALTKDDFPIQARPDCPECNGGHVLSRGTEWQCADCGKRWSKFNRRKK